MSSGRDIIGGPQVATLADGNIVITVSERLNAEELADLADWLGSLR